MSNPVEINILMDKLAEQRPADIALTIDDSSWTFGDIHRLSLKAATRLDRMGVGHDNVVALPLPNSIEQTAFIFGTWRLGATPMPLAPKLPDAELQRISAVADCHAIVREELAAGLEAEPLWLTPGKLASRCRAQTTGGSTGMPKVLFDVLPAQINIAADMWGYMEGFGMFVPGPTFHSGPMNHTVEGLTRGRHVIRMTKFDAARAAALITRHKPHWALFVPTMMNRLLKLPEEERSRSDFGCLKRVWHSAAACPSWLKQAWIDLVGPEVVWEIFGGSEGVSTTIISGTEWLEHKGSVGRPAYGQIAIFDADRNPVPPGVVGEIYMRSDLPRRFALTTQPAGRRLNGDWESFGDLGHLDEEGYLFLADRRVDMINSGGQNVYPAEVEAALQSYPGVADAVVFGQPDDDLGEVVCAMVYRENDDMTVDDLLRHLSTQVARYKIPRHIAFTTDVIRNDAGKVRRSELKMPALG